MGGNIGIDAVKGVRKIARKGLDQIPVVGSIVGPIINLLKRSDQQKLREWAFQDQIAKRYLTPSQYKQYINSIKLSAMQDMLVTLAATSTNALTDTKKNRRLFVNITLANIIRTYHLVFQNNFTCLPNVLTSLIA